jgi:hypothetical protein
MSAWLGSATIAGTVLALTAGQIDLGLPFLGVVLTGLLLLSLKH